MTLLRIAAFEVEKLLASRRGWLAILAFSLLWSMVLLYGLLPAARLHASPEAGQLLALLLDRFGFESTGHWPHPALAIYWLIAPYCLPLFVVLSAADQFASDRARGTLRFFALRSTRSDLFVGRFLGQCLILALLAGLTAVSVVAVLLVAGQAVIPSLGWLPPVWLHLVILLLPYAALLSGCSLLARSARQALWLALSVWILAWLANGWLVDQLGLPPVLKVLLPGATTAELVRRLPQEAWALTLIPLAQTLMLLGSGWLAMRRVPL